MREKIEKYIKERALENNVVVDASTNLYEAGVLDSMGIILLLVFIDETLGIKLNADSLDAENFQSIDEIVKFLS